ncbi:hypothetical protein [Candidatus Palauibacter sp.]|uniref:hypothetical protein n=1 Tax=Candidatus Palauibacter sp. TaxID=3101350 RepID=UPI003B5B21C5
MAKKTKKKRGRPVDVRALNPRYRGAMLSDVVRAVLRPVNPKARAALDKLRGRSVTGDKVAE